MTNLGAIDEALAGLTDIKLRAIVIASNESPRMASSLLAWIESACIWELNRRRGFDHELQPPEAAIDPSDEAVSIAATSALRISFAPVA